MTTPERLIHMQQINKVFTTGAQQRTALANINLDIYRGDYLSIQGPSGGGKSTLLSLIGLLDQATSGHYEIGGVTVTGLNAGQLAKVRNREIGFIFQDFNLIGDMTVRENVALPLLYRGIGRQEREDRVADVLRKVNLDSRANYLPTELSGGQQQRVAVARAIVGRPALLLADEPTGNLDSRNGDSVMALLGELNDDGATLCMVTHDSRYSDCAKRVVQLFDGRLADAGDSHTGQLAAVQAGGA